MSVTRPGFVPVKFLYGDIHSSFVALMRWVGQQRFTGGGGGVPGAFRAWRYVRPRGRGRAEVEVPGCSNSTVVVPSSAGSRTFAPGQRVSIGVNESGPVLLGEPPAGLLNQSRFGRQFLGGGLDQPILTGSSGIPSPGETLEVTFFGQGLRAGDLLTAEEFEEPSATSPGGWVPHPFVTIGGEANVSATEMTADVTVLASFPYPTEPPWPVSVKVSRG